MGSRTALLLFLIAAIATTAAEERASVQVSVDGKEERGGEDEGEESFVLDDILTAWQDNGEDDDNIQCKDALSPEVCLHHFVRRPSYAAHPGRGTVPDAPCATRPGCVNVCDAHPAQAARFCARSCGLCGSVDAGAAPALMRSDESLDPWTRLLKATHAAARGGHGGGKGEACCPSPEARAATRTEAARCADLEDVSRLAERGFVVLRDAVPPEELARMHAFVTDLPMPTSLLCGAADMQPAECTEDELAMRVRYPTFMGRMDATFRNWTESGVGKAAGLGWPMEITEGEFISINSPSRSAEHFLLECCYA